VVAPRSLPESVAVPENMRDGVPPVGPVAGINGLAVDWARLVHGDPRAAAHLATLLRRLGVVLRAEPFWPLAAREIGAELLATGLCGQPAQSLHDPEDVVVPSLRLLRQEAAHALGVPGPEGERRLAAALDEMVAGVVGALHRRQRLDEHAEVIGGLLPADRVVPLPGEHVPVVGERHLRASYEQSPVGVALLGLDGRVLDLNPVLTVMFGLDGPLDQPRPVSDFVHPDDMVDVVDRLQRLVRGDTAVVRMELRLVRVDSTVLWVHATSARVLDASGEPSHLVSVVEDLSDRHRLWSPLQEESFQDQLTRLPNRSVADEWLRRAFDGDGPCRVGVCSVELDGFQAVHERFGQQISDRILLGVAGRLRLAAGDHLVSRTGAGEFTVLMAEPGGASDVCRLADRLQAALATPFHIDGQTLAVSASIGVAESTTVHGSPAELVRATGVARSWAKALGGNRQVMFDPERDTAESARFALVSDLWGAIERGEFRLAFQPLVGFDGRRVHGAEALVRWHHPEQGMIGPGRFIELAEHSGAIVPLGRWVLEAACAQAAAWWHELGSGTPFVSVNVSPVQLAQAGWVDEVRGVLEATGLPAHLLQLEITEQAVLGDEEVAFAALTELRETGVRLALDDFGTGYSSLAWLRRLPVHALKIDGSFIDGLRTASPDPVDHAIVRALIEMAHALGLEVTAEWVETSLQAERLTALGCDVGQGRWFGDAGPGEWVPELWRRSIGG
jgi:diguanylate cyclase (GGDEF)-like protein/PAS domain S-box-containing protein